MDITNIVFDQVILYGSEIKRFTQIDEINPIPSNVIINKTVCGLGATHSEIVSPRDSIIVLPHLSIVKSKNKDPKYEEKTFAVHGDVTCQDVYKYLVNAGSQYRKLLTTPAGVEKIIKATEQCRLDYKDVFFILIDECHKLIQDADYRTDMVNLMGRFFTFKNKALISATPIPPSDPRFVANDFKHIRLSPDGNYKKAITVINTNSVTSALKKYLSDNPCKSYFIFFNSISGILSIIDKLKLANVSKIFCSEEYRKNLVDKSIENAFALYDGHAQYNFLTSSFYNGLDIHIDDFTPKVIIISDCKAGDHCIVDPYTDVLQIIGRFREKPDLKVVHINNDSHWLNPLSRLDAVKEISHSKRAYDTLLSLESAFTGSEDYFGQMLKSVKPYFNLLNDKGAFSFFLQDNYLDDNRTKQYYKSASALLSAYSSSKLYTVQVSNRSNYQFHDGERIPLVRQKVKYLQKTNKDIIAQLIQLEDIKGTDTYFYERLKIKGASPIFYEAFERLGVEVIIELKYNAKAVMAELEKWDIDEKLNNFAFYNSLQKAFRINKTYLISEVKETLKRLYDELDIPKKAKSTDIRLFYHTKEIWPHNDDNKSFRSIVLMEPKYNVIKSR